MSAFDPLDIQAYRDGQLSPDQARRLEAALDGPTKARVEAENRLEGRIVSRLRSEAASCPDPLWQDIQQRIRDRSGSLRPSRWWVSYVPVAAAILLVCGLLIRSFRTDEARAVEIPVDFAQNVAEFREKVSIRGDLETIQQRLREEGYEVEIGDIATCNRTHAHYVELIGMDPVTIDGKVYPCVRLSFTCCGQPVATYILKGADRRGSITFKPNLSSVNQAAHERSGYRIVTLSPHPTEAVESLFTAE